MQPISLLTGSSGLNTTVDPVRVKYNPDVGVSELSLAVDVTIDNTGQISRRQGFSQLVAGEFHSVWSDSGECFIVQETASYGSLMKVNNDLTITGLRSGLTKNKRMAFLDWNGETLYTNGIENGIVRNGVSYSWPTGTYAGPDTTRQFQSAPVGNHLAKYKGRVIVAVDNALFFSEPYAPGLFDLSRMFWQFPTRVRMVKDIDVGLFVSDNTKTYFLRGTSPLDFTQKVVANYPAHEWSVAHDMIEVDDLNVDEIGQGLVWSSGEGICLGLPSGRVLNISKNKVSFPKTYSKAATLVCGYHAINTMYY